MTARDSFNEMKFDEAEARRRRILELERENQQLREEIDRLKADRGRSWPQILEPIRIKKLKVGPPQHPGQLSIDGTEEAK